MNTTWHALRNLFFAAEVTNLTTADLEAAGVPSGLRTRLLSECRAIHTMEQRGDRPEARARARELCDELADVELDPPTSSSREEMTDILSQIPR